MLKKKINCEDSELSPEARVQARQSSGRTTAMEVSLFQDGYSNSRVLEGKRSGRKRRAGFRRRVCRKAVSRERACGFDGEHEVE